MIPLSLEAPAKLNLSLHVVGRRQDGYHLLESEMVLLELADRLLLLPGATGLRVEQISGDEIPVDQHNLAWRGLLAGLGAEPELACLALEKRIPAASGLGGGSSDAAAAWRLGRVAAGAGESATPDDLSSLARLGADVPFFAARCAAAHVTGIGEAIAPAPVPSAAWVVLVHPDFGLSTADVFGALRPDDHADRPDGNDLLGPALRLRPELGEIMGRMTAAGGEPRMTGAGSTIFTLTDDRQRAASIAARLRSSGMRVTETRLRSEAAAIIELGDASNDAGASPQGMG
ncbi:MAG: 4-(cytidine 5'-diphospho)-2-C-methyl-D-erythritol kinase [Chloroflexota bacterium]|nr:4-(cytidine 5'-diphospho)-2-C-methyl-D-erythritol kinase [Chloroflexota bacterium]